MCQEFLQKAWDAKEVRDYLAAEQNYLACLNCDPENAAACREPGLMYWGHFKKTPEAIELIEKSLGFEDCADGHLFLAMVNQACDRTRALSEFQVAIEAYKKEADVTGLMGHAHCYYASLLAQEGKLLDAENISWKLFGSTLRMRIFKEITLAFKNTFVRLESILRPVQDEH